MTWRDFPRTSESAAPGVPPPLRNGMPVLSLATVPADLIPTKNLPVHTESRAPSTCDLDTENCRTEESRRVPAQPDAERATRHMRRQRRPPTDCGNGR